MQKSLVNFHSGIEINLFRDVSRGSKKFDDWRMKQEGWKTLTRIGVLTRTSEEAWIKKVSLEEREVHDPVEVKENGSRRGESLEESSITIRRTSSL